VAVLAVSVGFGCRMAAADAAGSSPAGRGSKVASIVEVVIGGDGGGCGWTGPLDPIELGMIVVEAEADGEGGDGVVSGGCGCEVVRGCGASIDEVDDVLATMVDSVSVKGGRLTTANGSTDVRDGDGFIF
jgi:hypothetical protein